MPYVLAQSGAVAFFVQFAVLGGVVWVLHLLVGEVALRTKKSQRLIGYGDTYLGLKGKVLFTITTIFSVVGALLAYIVIGGKFLHTFLAPIDGLSEIAASFIFWAILSIFIIRGIQTISKAELIMNAALFGAVALILYITVPEFDSSNIVLFGEASFLLPFGVLLFAFTGWNAIPEVAELFKGKDERKHLDNIISWSTLVTLLLYGAFAVAIVGVTGGGTSEDALSSLSLVFGEKITALGAFFGLMAVAASYLVLGNYLKNSLRHDFGMWYWCSAAIAIVTPMALFVLGARDFIPILGIVGGVAVALEGMGILFLHRAAKQKSERDPEYSVRLPKILLWSFVLILGIGAILEIAK